MVLIYPFFVDLFSALGMERLTAHKSDNGQAISEAEL